MSSRRNLIESSHMGGGGSPRASPRHQTRIGLTRRGSGGSLWRTNTGRGVLPHEVVKKGKYYVSHPARVWTEVMVLEKDKDNRNCKVKVLEDGSEMTLNLQHVSMVPARYHGGNALSDLSEMPELGTATEPEILAALARRAHVGDPQPYTNVGHSLLVVNPLQDMPDPYNTLGEAQRKLYSGELGPHPFR
ncbi:unnamed protein product, partial [Chrysoparadoxa australica]